MAGCLLAGEGQVPSDPAKLNMRCIFTRVGLWGIGRAASPVLIPSFPVCSSQRKEWLIVLGILFLFPVEGFFFNECCTWR